LPRIGLISVWQEVNTYSPRATRFEHFEQKELAVGDDIVARHRKARSGLGGFLSEDALEHVPIFSAGAWPAGPPDAATADELLSRLDSALGTAGRLDGALIDLHGAMVCDEHPDMELDVVLCVRQHLGDRPIAAILDLHAIPSPESVSECDALIGYDTYPHVDIWERGREAATLMREMLAGKRLRASVSKLPHLTTPLAQGSDEEPMCSLNEQVREMAISAGLTRISLLPGFPYSDVERAGFSVIGVAEEARYAALEETLDEVAALVEGRIGEFSLSRPDPRQAVELAVSAERGPVILADIGDNVGGGGGGDGTALLHELLEQGVRGAVVTITDAEVAQRAYAEGPGAKIGAELGAKQDDLHGVPVSVGASIVATSEGRYVSRGPHFTGLEFQLGRSAVLDVDGIRILVTERAVPPFHGEQLTSFGIEPAKARVITAKGAIAWRTAFGDVAKHVIEVDTPGVTPLDPAVLPRKTAPMRRSARGA
jgi:microcystin degradation protein MlrC